MKTKITNFLLAFFIGLMVLPMNGWSQNSDPKACRSDEQQKAFWEAHPEAYQEYLQEQEIQEALIKHLKTTTLKGTSSEPDKYIIPVVFHVFGKTQSGKAVTYELIEDALRRTNKDFARKSPGQDNIHPRFKDVVGLLPIEFRLAKIDPNGNICTGVTFHPVNTGFGNGNGYDEEIQKYAWNNYKYMNVYIMNDLYDDGDHYQSGVSWYPQKWMSDNNLARTVYNGAFLGDNTDENFRRIITHEFGHFFNLKHTFEGGCPEKDGGDHCADTPPTDRKHMGVNELNCKDNYTNTQNFMNYTKDYEMFTKDQVIRMRAALQSPERITLWQEANLEATGVNDGFDAGKALVYESYLFEEAHINDGSIDTELTANLIGGANFTDGPFEADNHFKVYNVPEGLTAEITRVSTTKATIKLTGKATNHVAKNNINDMTIEFLESAFTTSVAEIKNTKIESFSIGFKDAYTKFCFPKPDFKTYAGISNVKFAGINNPSEVKYYSNFMENQVAIVTTGEKVELSITLNKHETGTNDFNIIHAWLDKNGDFVFNEDEEIVDHTMQFTQADASGNYTYTQEITIPEDMITDKVTGLRVMTNFKTGNKAKDGYDPCGNIESGALIDYGVIVKPSVSEVLPDFLISNPTVLIKHKVKITDYSNSPVDDPITNWNWTFEGGVPNTFKGKNPPEIYYKKHGVYDISLEVTAKSGATQTKTKKDAIIVKEQYCAPSTQYGTYSGITNVQLGTINNPTKNWAQYMDYRFKKFTTVKTGEKIPFSLTLDAGISGKNDAIGIAIWIDWNHNSELEASERAFYKMMSIAAFTNKSYTLTGNIIVPIDAAKESTIARIMVYYAGDEGDFVASPCSVVESGEIEDYGLIIQGSSASASVDFEAEKMDININYPIKITDKSKSQPTDPIKSWNWTFEGGTPASSVEQNPTVYYTEDGSYDISLEVTTKSGKKHSLTKEQYIKANYSVCEVKQKYGTHFGHITRIQIGGIDYSTPTKELPAYINLMDKNVVAATEGGEIDWTVTCSKGACTDRDNIGLKIFLDSERNDFTAKDEIFSDNFYTKDTDDKHVFTGKFTMPDTYKKGKVVALRFVAYYRGKDGIIEYDIAPCEGLDSGNGVDFGIGIDIPNAIEKQEALTGVKVYPNPVKNILTISVENENITYVRVFDITGSLIKEKPGNQNSSMTVNFNDLSTGIYLVEINTKNGTKLMKVIK
ncbi:T9SS C-terminal target domain-containing protein [Marinilabiliaceae bacterium JC017]|nr:T9SS C-terminal target domain-containing protein [Marinilabiliaceae bacterium JC017]